MSTTLTQIRRGDITTLATRAAELLKPLEAEFGITLKPGKSRYSNASYGTLVFEVGVSSSDGKPTGKDAEAFLICARLWGLTPDDLGRSFSFRGRTMTIIGCNPKSRTYPICIKRDDGKTLRIDASLVKSALVNTNR